MRWAWGQEDGSRVPFARSFFYQHVLVRVCLKVVGRWFSASYSDHFSVTKGYTEGATQENSRGEGRVLTIYGVLLMFLRHSR